jgi:hypothetical protein
MSAMALRKEATTLVESLDESQLMYVIQFMKFINQQNAMKKQKENRDKRDYELINASCGKLNEEAEENLDFQADIWSD